MSLEDLSRCNRELEKFKCLFESAPDATVIVDSEGKISLVNAQTVKLFGYSREELLGKDLELLIPERFRGHHKIKRKGFSEAPGPRQMGMGMELSAVKKNGEEFFVEISLSPVNTADGLYIASAIRDITEKKAMQKEIADLNSALESKIIQRTLELEASNKELEAFSYSVSHDLRTPLRAIHGYAEVLEDDFGPTVSEEEKRVIDLIKKNAINMGLQVDNLLSFSRLGRKDIRRTFVDMNEVCKDVLDEINEGKKHKAQIRAGNLHPVTGDKAMIRVVLMNLIANAIKFSANEENPRVQIQSEDEGEQIVYSVKDNGVGFDMDFAPKLFNVFERLHSVKQFEGTGVGLAIVKRIIQKHGGNVWAESRENQGATFYFSLPKSADELNIL